MNNYQVDVVIVGGGLAGCTAALAVRRFGARVLLIEKKPILGGVATASRVHSMLTFHGKSGHRVIGGIPQKIIDNLKNIGGTPGHIRDTIGVAYSVTPVDPDKLAYVLQDMLDEAGADYLLESTFLEPVMNNNRITGVRGIHQGGTFTAEAPVFIDASGEGILAVSAGAAGLDDGASEPVMPATLIFEVRGVDIQRICEYMQNNKDDFHDETLFDELKTSQAIGVSGFFKLWDEAILPVPRDRLLFYQTINPDEVAFNTTRVTNFNPLDPGNYANAYQQAREQMFEIYQFLTTKIPGFENSVLSGVAPFLGVREVRRIKGQYVLTGEDVSVGRRFSDEIALGGFPIDIHVSTGPGLQTVKVAGHGYYGIPYRCLLPEGVSNLLVVGKCFSAERQAHASARVQATTMAMGQASGAAAALAAFKNTEPAGIPTVKVQQAVVHLGGILEPEEKDDLW
jgi:hypothetical protein